VASFFCSSSSVPGAVLCHELFVFLVNINGFIRTLFLVMQEVCWRRMEYGHLVHHVSRSLRLLEGSSFLAHGQQSMGHHQVIVAIRQRQFSSLCYIKCTLEMLCRHSLMYFQMTNCFLWKVTIKSWFFLVILHISLIYIAKIQKKQKNKYFYLCFMVFKLKYCYYYQFNSKFANKTIYNGY